jgi:DNA-binding phage protein
MEPLALQLVAAIPRLSSTGRAMLALLADSDGRNQSADSLALHVGLRSRHQLARALRREGLPQIEELCAWVKALNFLLRWEHCHRSLYTLALDAALYPPTCYRLVKRVTGKTWRQTCADGFGMMLVSFVNRCSTLRPARNIGAQPTVGNIA